MSQSEKKFLVHRLVKENFLFYTTNLQFDIKPTKFAFFKKTAESSQSEKDNIWNKKLIVEVNKRYKHQKFN